MEVYTYIETPGEEWRSNYDLKLNLLDVHINTNALKKRLHFITRRSLNPSLNSFTSFELCILRCILKMFFF